MQLAVGHARAWLLRRFGPDPTLTEVTLVRRLLAILVRALVNVILPVLVIIGLHAAVLYSTGFTEEIRRLLDALTFSVLQLVILVGLSAAALSPRLPAWRISRFTDRAARELHRSIRLWAAVGVVVNVFLVITNPASETTAVMRIIHLDAGRSELAAITVLLGLVTMVSVTLFALRRRNWRFNLAAEDEAASAADAPPSTGLRWLLTLARVALVASVGVGVFGYLNLGVFLASRVIRSLLLIALALLIRQLIQETVTQIQSPENRLGMLVRTRLAVKETSLQRALFWLMLAIDVLLTVVAVSVLVLIWGLHGSDLLTLAQQVFQGVNVGSFRLSLADLVIAASVFLALLFIIRLFQRFLSGRVLSHTSLDVGIRDAVTAGVGYVGIFIAALVCISLLGLELSQLAIIFGALSVGIGFGLQNLVNNFVSGLILLAQRPIKAGDWVVVGSQEGYVKRVNVTSTEIQTFDNASLIVPNSQLVSNEVLNWMHKSKLGRVIVGVGVSYDSDPEQVRQVLLGCARQNEEILARPAPTVIFREFGNSSLDFELRFYIRDIDRRLTVGSDIRFAVKQAFTEAGIEIPFPQQDIHVRDIGTGVRQSIVPDEAAGNP